MKNLLILANDYKTIANFRMELLRSLCGSGYHVFVSLPEDPRNQAVLDLGCTVLPAPISRHGKNPFAELKLIGVYKKQIRQCNADCVLTFTVKPNIYGAIAAAALHVPCINNVTGLGSVLQSESLLKKLMLQLQKYAYRKSACVFFQNAGNLEYFRSRKIVADQARLLPGSGVNLDLHEYTPFPSEQQWIDIAIVSRLRQDKGFDEFFEMIDAIMPQYPKVRFHIVGWIEEERYQAVVDGYEGNTRVIYHGELTQTQVHGVLGQCHCLCHPSYHEGMANVLLEAAAAGRVTIASDIPGCTEAIDDGETGFVCQANSAQSLIQAMQRFLALEESAHEQMGKRARMKMEREFDRQIVVRKYIEQIEALSTSKVGV